MLIFSRGHLERVLTVYVEHYNGARPHRLIDLDAPVPLQPVTNATAHICRADRLGGLIHEYRRAA